MKRPCLAMLLPTLLFAETPRLPGVGAALQKHVDAGEIAGAVTMVVTKDRILHLETTGLADIASARPMTPDTICVIMSMTKPLTGAAVLMLQDETEGEDTVRALQAAGLDKLAFTKRPDEPWPTLGELVRGGTPLIVFSQREGGDPPWFLPMFSLVQDNPYTTRSTSESYTPSTTIRREQAEHFWPE